MPLNRSSLFLEVIEELSKSTHISEGDVLSISKIIISRAAHFLKINRVNAWLINDDGSKLTCLSAYDKSKEDFYDEGILYQNDFPIYFNHINGNDIIICDEARKEPFNCELLNSYLIPNNIYSMMEVPLISGGDLKGIICYENTDEIKSWSNDEQHFALALTQLLVLTIEIQEKNTYREALEKSVKEKSVLIAEINHRVKNNLAVITALIRTESFRVKDEYHKELFNNVLLKTFSLSTLQHSMYHSQNYKEANFSEFIGTLLGNLNDTYGHNLNVALKLNLGDEKVDIDKAISCSLIVNEILTNCYKYAFTLDKNNSLSVDLAKINESTYELIISDNGPGLPADYATRGTGFDLISGLVDQIDGSIEIDSTSKGTTMKLRF
jgi:two-component sensor histidine kinase